MPRYRTVLSVLLASSVIAGGALGETGDASTSQKINVGPEMPIKDIQTAVNLAHPGDIVVVWPGVYAPYVPQPGVPVIPEQKGTVQIAPALSYSFGGGGSGSSGWGNGTTAFEQNVEGVNSNIGNTDEQVVNKLLQGEKGAWNRLDAILSGKSVTGEINKAINKGTNTVTGAIGDKIDDATDTVLDPVEDEIDTQVDSAVEAVQCNMAGSAVAAAAGAVSSIWGGGDATYGAQLAQWLTQTASNLCQGKQVALEAQQLKVQRRQRDLMRKMVAGLNANAAGNAAITEDYSRSVLGSVDSGLYAPKQEDILWGRYQSGMPEGWTWDAAAQYTRSLREQTNLASQEAAAAQAASYVSIGSALNMAEQAQDLSNGADGQTQAIQAQTQMLRSQIALDASRQAADAAHATALLRIAEEQRAAEVYGDQKIQRLYGPSAAQATKGAGVSHRSLFN